MVERELLVRDLFNIGAIKFGDYRLKSGVISPIYFDFRAIVSYPELMIKVSNEMWSIVSSRYSEGAFTHVCGVPYTALPIASCISTTYKIPMILKRKEQKTYGTGCMVEGAFISGETSCLVVEDVVTTGSSVLEVIEILKNHGITATDVVLLLDRQQGAKKNFDNANIRVHTLFAVDQFLEIARDLKIIDEGFYLKCTSFMEAIRKSSNENLHSCDDKNKLKIHNGLGIDINPSSEFLSNEKKIAYNEGIDRLHRRMNEMDNRMNSRLLEIIIKKKTNLCVSADVNFCNELITLAEKVGPFICVLKTHIDILNDFNSDFLARLKEISMRHSFLLFEDRKFADIGSTVKQQIECKHFDILNSFDIINAHVFPGNSLFKGIESLKKPVSCLLIAEMSTENNLFNDKIKQTSIQYAEEYPHIVSGFICQNLIDKTGKLLHMTPGINLEAPQTHKPDSVEVKSSGDGLGQTYRSIESAITNGSDIVIIGRSIYRHPNPEVVAKEASQRAFNALVLR